VSPLRRVGDRRSNELSGLRVPPGSDSSRRTGRTPSGFAWASRFLVAFVRG
jgi:hypothetical protein